MPGDRRRRGTLDVDEQPIAVRRPAHRLRRRDGLRWGRRGQREPCEWSPGDDGRQLRPRADDADAAEQHQRGQARPAAARARRRGHRQAQRSRRSGRAGRGEPRRRARSRAQRGGEGSSGRSVTSDHRSRRDELPNRSSFPGPCRARSGGRPGTEASATLSLSTMRPASPGPTPGRRDSSSRLARLMSRGRGSVGCHGRRSGAPGRGRLAGRGALPAGPRSTRPVAGAPGRGQG